MNEENELESLSPFLSKLKREDGYTVPENYFDTLPSRIQERIKLEKGYETKVVGFSRSKYIQIISAACFVIMIGYFILSSINKTNEVQISLQDLDMNDFDSEMVIEVAGEDYINEKNNMIDNYIINHVDEEMLIEQL